MRAYLWNQRHTGRLVALKDGRHVLAIHAPNASAGTSLDDGGDVRSKPDPE